MDNKARAKLSLFSIALILLFFCSNGFAAECVDMPRLMDYVGDWKLGSISMFSLMEKMALWKTGGGCTVGLTYYLDATNGNDGNDGLSPETAWQTISKAREFRYQTGDDLLFKRGETFTYSVYFIIRHSGTAHDPAIFGAYGEGPKPIITTPYGGFSSYTPNLSHVLIQDLDVRDANIGQSISFGADNMSNITIRRVNINGNITRTKARKP